MDERNPVRPELVEGLSPNGRGVGSARARRQHAARAAAIVFLIGALLALPACASTRQAQAQAPAERTVYLVRHGWHTGIVFRKADLPADSPLRREFPQADHVEAGWGDRDYYMAQDPGLWLGLRALLWPTPGVLHIVGVNGPPRLQFPEATVIELGVTQPGLERMHEQVRSSFERDASGAVKLLGPGLYGDGRFYASVEAFHGLKTCNVWTARLLRAGGLPVTPGAAITADMLLGQVLPLAP